MLQVLLLLCVLFKAAFCQVVARGDSRADYGSDVHFTCTLGDPIDVRQVTWQRKKNPDSIESLATYSKRFDMQVNDPFQGKVILSEASLNSTSITVKNVTWRDEACYICSFNAYLEGSKKKQICLNLEGISDVKTDVQQTLSMGPEADMEVVLSCSARGKPAPAIQWDISPAIDSNESNNRMANDDHTFTTNSSITLRLPRHWDGQVDCLVNNGTKGQRRERIVIPNFPVGEGGSLDDKGGGGQLWIAGAVVIIISIISCVAIYVLVKRKRQQCKGDVAIEEMKELEEHV